MAMGRDGSTKAWTFLGTFGRDVRANTLAMMTAAIIPLAGMVGGGIDLTRMYIVKTRLQHGCDAGALAGRKVMGGGTWTQTVGGVANYPLVTAQKFFESNYDTAAYGATNVTKTFTESGGKVTGTASAVVPMTLMRIFGKTSQTLTVTCDAEMRLPNTDIMFVLDTTGSMDWCPNGDFSCAGGPSSRIAGLRIAVKCFFEIVAKLDTNATCAAAAPSGGIGNGAQIRFGFMPYSTNVNVGKLLPNSYFVDHGSYQTRTANTAVPPKSIVTAWQIYSGGSITQADCFSYMKNMAFGTFTPTPTTSGGPPPTATVVTTFNSDGAATADVEWGWQGADRNGTSRACRRSRTDETTYYVPKFASWNYGFLDVPVSALKAGGSSWNNSFTAAIGDTAVGNDVTNATVVWQGCIEERATDEYTDFDPIPAGALDLDIDLVPNSADDDTRWKPALPQLIFTRRTPYNSGANYNATSWGGSSTSYWSTPGETTSTDYNNGSSFACPTEARKLQSWTSASTFSSYVDSLDPGGATYHDIGLLWGARFMSPTGIFASENAQTPQGGEIDRHMIFMTDGDTNANANDYAAYGLPFFDHRQTPASPTKAQLDEQVNLRFLALCRAVRTRNITLWVISFGTSVNQANLDRLEECASPGRFFVAADSTILQQQFAAIANQISQLRLVK